MKVGLENIEQLPVKDQGLCRALLTDLAEMNEMAPDVGFYITFNDDTSDDYYGSYRLKSTKIGESESFGVEMDIHELDNAICVAYDIVNNLIAAKQQ